ncbi:hypothetical protein [Nocardioides zhouii]|uniref:Uncharacterized protein n=1 Tax=Nocardioides zhouii TaxID=1168729 RepID=A0A4Q2SYV3_9ACTN|nr:hypothetical protein [Nocardioides zhouii]RYC11405.1 hypothetical protein EUA94_08480 [Nocardioides zhouii]
MQEEFGTPEECAAGFAPDRARKHRWEAMLLAFLGIMQGLWLLDGFSWLRAAVAVGFLLCAWAAYRRTD